MYQYIREEITSNRLVSSTLTVGKKAAKTSIQFETKEVHMKRNIIFKMSLKQKLIVGLCALISLDFCGVSLARSNATS